MDIHMSVAKVLELTARSTEAFEDAVHQAMNKAGESVHAIREASASHEEIIQGPTLI